MKRNRLRLAAVAAIAAMLLAACSSMPKLEGDKIEYKSAGRLPPLEIPPDLTRPTTDDRYAVPDISPKGEATYSAYNKDRSGAPANAESLVLPKQDNARIERSGSQRWLVVKGDAAAVWPVVKEFWQENGFIINVEIPEAGVMETDWAENRANIPGGGGSAIRSFLGKVLDSVYSTAERDKFRTRLERGTESVTTEIYISHRGMEEVYTASEKSDTKWQPRPPDPDLEAEMLRRLMVRFGVQQERVKSEIASSAKAVPANATLSRSADGIGMLSLNDQFDRAWRRVGLALDRVGFTVEDRDRSKGLYFVRYVDPDADNKTAQSKGFFAKLNPFSSSSKQPSKEQYRIQVKDAYPLSQVKVLNKDGNQEKSDTANRILTLLYEQLK
jgi:outer membrane protein assembly factor BamC